MPKLSNLTKLIRAEKKMYPWGRTARRGNVPENYGGVSNLKNTKHRSWKIKRTKIIGEVK